MDKISKALKKLSNKERDTLKKTLATLNGSDFRNLDIKKLKNHDSIFRVRVGSLRIIYRLEGKKTFLLTIERRNNNTYKF